MSDMKRVNPALMLEAAKKAEPVNCNGEKLDWRILEGVGVVNGRFVEEEFNPLTSDSDAMKLERELRKLGWRFWGYPDGHCFADNRRMMIEMIDADTDALLFLKCVVAMTSLPLYAEESMG